MNKKHNKTLYSAQKYTGRFNSCELYERECALITWSLEFLHLAWLLCHCHCLASLHVLHCYQLSDQTFGLRLKFETLFSAEDKVAHCDDLAVLIRDNVSVGGKERRSNSAAGIVSGAQQGML